MDQKSLETVFWLPFVNKMAIKNSVSSDFWSMFVDSINVCDADNDLNQNVFLKFDNGPYLGLCEKWQFFYETRPRGYKTWVQFQTQNKDSK